MRALLQLVLWVILLGATFALCEIGKINAFVARLTGHTWNLRNYFLTFWAIFGVVALISLWLSSRWKPSPAFPVTMVQVLLGMVMGHAVAILSYVVATLLGPNGFERLMDPTGVFELIMFLLIMPVVLLGWLYGGVFVSLYVLGRKIANRRIMGGSLTIEAPRLNAGRAPERPGP